MKKCWKIFSVLYILIILIIGCTITNVHEHTFSNNWSSDSTNHWHAATCEHTDEISDLAEHTFGEWKVIRTATEETDGSKEKVCSVCDYKITKIIPKTNDANENEEDQNVSHSHKYSNNWSNDSTNHWHAATCEHTGEILDLAEHTFDTGKLTKVPTTSETGIFTYSCTVCNYNKNLSVLELKKHSLISTGTPETITDTGKYRVYKSDYKCSFCGITCSQYTYANYGLNRSQWAAIESGLNSQYFYENQDYKTKSNEACSVYSDDLIIGSEIFSITYILNGGSNNFSNPSQYTRGQVVTLYEPTKSGCIFLGWYENENLTGARTTNITSSNSNKTFYAKWGYEISYELNSKNYYTSTKYNAINNESNPTSYDGTKEIILYEPSRLGFKFLGWYSDSNCQNGPVSKIAVGETGSKTFYAKWELITYSINYDENGGTNSLSNIKIYSIESFDNGNTKLSNITIPIYEPTKNGYFFDGWYTSSTFAGSSISEISFDITKLNEYDIALYAKWIPNEISVNAAVPIYSEIPDLSTPTNTGSALIFTVPDIYTNYNWYIDNNKSPVSTTNTLTINYLTSNISNGYHNITIEVKHIDGNFYSATYEFSIQR